MVKSINILTGREITSAGGYNVAFKHIRRTSRQDMFDVLFVFSNSQMQSIIGESSPVTKFREERKDGRVEITVMFLRRFDSIRGVAGAELFRMVITWGIKEQINGLPDVITAKIDGVLNTKIPVGYDITL